MKWSIQHPNARWPLSHSRRPTKLVTLLGQQLPTFWITKHGVGATNAMLTAQQPRQHQHIGPSDGTIRANDFCLASAGNCFATACENELPLMSGLRMRLLLQFAFKLQLTAHSQVKCITRN